ncbi:membrane protein [Marinomonas sp. SBI22]|uniref:HPP family protein n=1 Tax=unclassified Marinomonas TaxID=196814 RepID=UPI0007AEF7B0|nr:MULTISPECIES: HPP family protein [unclassified Marinomonas]KZM43041.1 membrane protein [Marinomonas sp. SBI22]KZM44612.1 membrane protein [Marinomonas sp. SBI8L]
MGRFSGGGKLVPKPDAKAIATGFIGGFVGILSLALLTSWSGYPLLMAPFGATCVILFTVAAAPFAQPRNVIGGHFISALVGLVALYFFGQGPIVMAFAVATAIAAMQFFRAVHPPAGANPLVILMAGSAGFDFLLLPVLLGSIVLVGVAAVINNAKADAKWPLYWIGKD